MKKLVGIRPEGPGRHTVGGVTLIYSSREIIGGAHLDILSYEFITAEDVRNGVPEGVNGSSVAHGFTVALNCAVTPMAELFRVANLVREE